MPSANRQVAFRVDADEEAAIEAAMERTGAPTLGAFAKTASLQAAARENVQQPRRAPRPKPKPARATLMQCGSCGAVAKPGGRITHQKGCPRG